ncbi:PilZ domain-containing protein [Candidatus Omnitrophota bacterium]
MKNTNILQRRGHERIKTDAYIAVIMSEGIKSSVDLENISTRGFCGLTLYPLMVNEEVEIILHYPFFFEPLRKKARVVWRQQNDADLWQVGLDFGADNKIDLSSYIKLNPLRNFHHAFPS